MNSLGGLDNCRRCIPGTLLLLSVRIQSSQTADENLDFNLINESRTGGQERKAFAAVLRVVVFRQPGSSAPRLRYSWRLPTAEGDDPLEPRSASLGARPAPGTTRPFVSGTVRAEQVLGCWRRRSRSFGGVRGRAALYGLAPTCTTTATTATDDDSRQARRCGVVSAILRRRAGT